MATAVDELALHALGRSHFTGDLPLPPGTLHAAPVLSPIAHGRILSVDAAQALALPGVRAVLAAVDIPGENRIGVVADDEPLMAAGEACFAGQVVALVVADDAASARFAAGRVRVTLEPLPARLDARQAAAAGELFAPPRVIACGDPEAGFAAAAHVVVGRLEAGGQEHVYLETQAALAIPGDDGSVLVHSATQSPSGTQAVIARILGLAMHRVEVDVKRLGGGFGGKESQASCWAALAALAAVRCGAPVKLVLTRTEDLRATGKRHPYGFDYRLGLDREGRILAWAVDFYQNAGAFADLSLAVLERSLFHAGGAYRIPAMRATGYSCRTHLPPFTAMRGFGAPQAFLVLEAAIGHAAVVSGIPADLIRERNLLAEGDAFPYGQEALRCRLPECWRRAVAEFDVERRRAEIAAFNAGSPLLKKGLALMPIAFGIAFTHRPLNQASALLHVYGDGSVGFTTGGVEMGQGVMRKLRRVVALELGLELERIRDESTNTARVANVTPSAASATADLNGQALIRACVALRARLLALAADKLGLPADELRLEREAARHRDEGRVLPWRELVALANGARVSLTAQAHYATPELWFDWGVGRGHPFGYHVYGAAVVEASLDVLRGTCRIERVDAVHDAGRSLDPFTDRGQVEGAVVQGLGWLTSEELLFDGEGRLLSDSLAGYKPPDIHAAPEIRVLFPDEPEPRGLLMAKAVGEPPLLYAIGAYGALHQALAAARPERGVPQARISHSLPAAADCEKCGLDAPLTPERLLMALYGGRG